MRTPATSHPPGLRSRRRADRLRHVRRARRYVFLLHYPFPHLDFGNAWVVTFTWSVQ